MSKHLLATMLALAYVYPLAASQRALLMGNDSYPGQKLLNGRNDARAFAEGLVNLHWETTLLLDGTQKQMNAALSSFIEQVEPEDTALIYYSGHGMQLNGVNYMIPIDFQLVDGTEAERSAISLADTVAELNARHVRMSVIILDACRDNPFLNSNSRALHPSGWANVPNAQGTFIAFGTSPGSVAADGPKAGHGLFTQAILFELKEHPDADLDSFFRLVRERVIADSAGLQVPWSASSLTGEASFASSRSAPRSFATNQLTDSSLQGGSRSLLRSLENPSDDQDDEGNDATREQLRNAIELVKDSQTEEAVRSISSVLAKHPHMALALRILSLIFEIAGRSVDSMREADQAIASSPNDARGFLYKGLSEVSVDPTGAIRDAQAALGLDPSSQEAHQILASGLLCLGRQDDALQHAEKAIQLDPSSATGYSLLGKIYQQMGDFPRASHAYELAIRNSDATQERRK